MDGLDGELGELGSSWGDGEGVSLQIRAPQKLGRASGDTIIPEIHLKLRDQVGADHGSGLWADGSGLIEGGRRGKGRQTSGFL